MQAFATEFPLNHDATGRTFLDAVRTWILGSPHTILLASDLADLGHSDESSMPSGAESVSSLCPQGGDEDAAAARYVRVNEDLEWTTTIVFRRLASGPWTSIRVSCESTYPQKRLPPAKKPVLVRVLMQNLGTGKDGAFALRHTEHMLRDEDIDMAAALINGTANCRLPVVYVSARFDGLPAVDARAVSGELAGMAHVVVEPNRSFSKRLRISVEGNNVYGGTVGVYWPDGSGRRAFYLGPDLRNSGDLVDAICGEVRAALVNRRPLEDCTWSAVQGIVSRHRIRQLQASGSQQVQDYVDTFERELGAEREQRERAEREVERLGSEVRRLQAQGAIEKDQPPLRLSEQDFYWGESSDIIHDAIKEGRGRVRCDSRRQHVLDAFLEAYPASGTVAKQRELLKEALRGYKSLDKKTRGALESLGFAVSAEGKHYKIVFQGDDRYTFTLPKSGSDHRGGLNAASEIGKLLF